MEKVLSSHLPTDTDIWSVSRVIIQKCVFPIKRTVFCWNPSHHESAFTAVARLCLLWSVFFFSLTVCYMLFQREEFTREPALLKKLCSAIRKGATVDNCCNLFTAVQRLCGDDVQDPLLEQGGQQLQEEVSWRTFCDWNTEMMTSDDKSKSLCNWKGGVMIFLSVGIESALFAIKASWAHLQDFHLNSCKSTLKSPDMNYFSWLEYILDQSVSLEEEEAEQQPPVACIQWRPQRPCCSVVSFVKTGQHFLIETLQRIATAQWHWSSFTPRISRKHHAVTNWEIWNKSNRSVNHSIWCDLGYWKCFTITKQEKEQGLV